MKYKPQTKDELKELLKDENIYLSDIDTSLITDMSNIFHESLRKDFKGIEKWNTSNVKDMHNMFSDAVYFNHNIEKWNVSKVENMGGMFLRCLDFNQPINDWNVSNVKDMGAMFAGAESFNMPLNKWNTCNVFDMRAMFNMALNFNQDLNNWDTSNVENMNGMFSQARNFNQPLDKWNTSNVKTMQLMFNGCINFNQDLNSWNTSNVENMHGMFYDAKNFNQPLNNWKVNKVVDMSEMFSKSGFQYYDSLEDWNIESLEYLDDWSDVISKNIDKLSLKWILYLYAFYNDNKIIIKKIEENIKDIHKISSEIKNKKVQFAKRKLENIYYDDLKEVVDYEIFDSIEKYEETIKLSKKDEKKVSYIENCNVLIKDKSRIVDIKVIKYIYLKYLELKRDIYYLLEINSIIDLLDKESFLSFAKNIYIETHKETSAIVYSLYGGDEALREIYKKEKDSNFLLIILSSVKTTQYSIKLLYDIYSKTKKSELKEEAFYLINNKISKEIGLDIDDLELKFSSNFGFDSRGEKIINDDYKLILNSDYSVKVFDIKNNKELKTTPKNLEESIKAEIKYIKKEIPDIIKKLSLKLTKLLIYEKKYNYSFFKEVFINNPIMNKFSSSLIWDLYDKDSNFITTFRYAGDGSYSNCEDEEVTINENSFISLASPAEMDDETINKWKRQLEDYELSQPINQLTIIRLNKNNLESEINKLQNVEISYGSFKAFGIRYSMSPNYLDFGVVESYNLKKGGCFEIKINANSKIDYKDKVKININFYNENNKKVSERFIYTLLILMICDFRLTDIFA
ncbi:BspA family leucine-rich repeat surface protein [Brachyspira alvinipulli]|uniref:BspA family leucine-rich repeat surface protein n=1 Tax=Brachyspira alvinipulli TaxID=84379 RepID=UPI000484CBBE|nr:BspA family leucine-rich repeat surface protein [Brachyspira alvinipulli]